MRQLTGLDKTRKPGLMTGPDLFMLRGEGYCIILRVAIGNLEETLW